MTEAWETNARLRPELAAWRQQMMHLDGVIAALYYAVYVVDAEGRITFGNPAFARLIGLPLDQLLGRLSLTLYADSAGPMLLERRRQGFGDESLPPTVETTIIRADGMQLPVELTETPLNLGTQTVGYVAIVRDITTRKRTEEALRLQAQIIDQIHESVVSTDLDGAVTSWNKGAERLFGYTAPEALGQHIAFVYPADQQAFLQHGVIAPLKAQGNHEIEVRMHRKSGEEFDAHLALSLLRDHQGTPTGMIGYALDITARKQAEAALHARVRQQEAIATLGLRALAGNNLSSLMDDAVALIARTLDVEYAKVLELLPDGKALILRAGVGWTAGMVGHATVEAGVGSQAGYTLLSSEPVIVQDYQFETRFRSASLLTDHGAVSGVSVVIHGHGRPFGVLGAHARQRRSFTADDAYFMQAMANVLAEAIEQTQAEQRLTLSQAQLRALAAHLQSVREEERTRIARELHDELGQVLTGLNLQLAWVAQRLSHTAPPGSRSRLQEQIESMMQLVARTIQSVQRIATELRPALLDDFGLAAAIKWQAQEFQARTGLGCQLTLELEEAQHIEADRATAAYRICQEALTNVARHAHATKVEIHLYEEAGGLVLELRDDGTGITERQLSDVKSLGLLGMQERALVFGGEVTIHGMPGHGTTVTARIPLRAGEGIGATR